MKPLRRSSRKHCSQKPPRTSTCAAVQERVDSHGFAWQGHALGGPRLGSERLRPDDPRSSQRWRHAEFARRSQQVEPLLSTSAMARGRCAAQLRAIALFDSGPLRCAARLSAWPLRCAVRRGAARRRAAALPGSGPLDWSRGGADAPPFSRRRRAQNARPACAIRVDEAEAGSPGLRDLIGGRLRPRSRHPAWRRSPGSAWCSCARLARRRSRQTAPRADLAAALWVAEGSARLRWGGRPVR